ncbi:glycosyltransferase [Massilicoli timonensis]|uniref:glycosyltransferase n=1 Tax=Massilicoli timonensis TaxID=2015901 RepID=UPI0015E07D73|nr:glycosyltransferase [Massilicoli timonensis]
MKIAFCSLILPEDKNLTALTKGEQSGIALSKVCDSLLRGFDENGIDVTAFNIINTLNYPKIPKVYFKTEKWEHNKMSNDYHIGYINIFGIKYITQARNLYRGLSTWIKKNKDHSIVCIYFPFYPSIKAVYKIKKKYKDKVKVCFITGDIYGSDASDFIRERDLKQKIHYFFEKRMNQMIRFFDYYAFATEAMAPAIGVEKKPNTIVECLYKVPDKRLPVIEEESSCKTIFYAGGIRLEYGIKHLIESFKLIQDNHYKLIIAGHGKDKNYVEQASLLDSRIEYIGQIPPEKVYEYQQKATVLINPRISGDYEFVKYTFPSKTVDCLAAGKPYIAHRLAGIPIEYDDYIQYPEDESNEALANKIIEICNLEKEVREKIGQKGKDFIYREKNAKVMTQKIIDMIERNI